MNAKLNLDALSGKIVYVKPVEVSDLPEDLREQAGTLTTIFAVHDAEGAQLALVADRRMAFALARHHHMHPVTVH